MEAKKIEQPAAEHSEADDNNFAGAHLETTAGSLHDILKTAKISGQELVHGISIKRVTMQPDPAQNRLIVRAQGQAGVLTTALPGECQGDRITTDLDKLLSIAGLSQRDDPLNLDAQVTGKQRHIKVTTPRGRFTLPLLLDGYHIESPAPDNDGVTFEVQVDRMRDALRRIRHAAPFDDARHYLNGVNFRVFTNGSCLLTASDGHRLSREVIPGPMDMETDCSVIIPRPTVDSISGLLSSRSEANVRVFVGERNAWISGAAENQAPLFHLDMTLVDGNYPDVNRLIPNVAASGVLNGPKELLTNAIDFAMVFREDKRTYIRFKSVGDKVIADFGVDEQRLEVPLTCQGNVDFVVNPTLLREALSAVPDGTVTLRQFSSDEKMHPVELTFEEVDDFFELIMPMKL